MKTKSAHEDQFRSVCDLIFQHIGLEVSRANVIVTYNRSSGQGVWRGSIPALWPGKQN